MKVWSPPLDLAKQRDDAGLAGADGDVLMAAQPALHGMLLCSRSSATKLSIAPALPKWILRAP
jgi:hypothetical protein